MNNRRSFFKMLGLGAVAAPSAIQALQVEAAPVSAVAINAKWREANRVQSWTVTDPGHTHTITPAADATHTHTMSDDYGRRVWVDWAKRATS